MQFYREQIHQLMDAKRIPAIGAAYAIITSAGSAGSGN